MKPKIRGEITACVNGCVPVGQRITHRQVQEMRDYVAEVRGVRRKW
jgi:iron only hydrogenase large subunit-like protein